MCDVLAACPISIRTDETATTFSFVNRLPICDCLMQTERNHRKEGQEQGEREGGGAGRKQNRQTRDYELIVGRCEPIGAIVGQRRQQSSAGKPAHGVRARLQHSKKRYGEKDERGLTNTSENLAIDACVFVTEIERRHQLFSANRFRGTPGLNDSGVGWLVWYKTLIRAGHCKATVPTGLSSN